MIIPEIRRPKAKETNTGIPVSERLTQIRTLWDALTFQTMQEAERTVEKTADLNAAFPESAKIIGKILGLLDEPARILVYILALTAEAKAAKQDLVTVAIEISLRGFMQLDSEFIPSQSNLSTHKPKKNKQGNSHAANRPILLPASCIELKSQLLQVSEPASFQKLVQKWEEVLTFLCEDAMLFQGATEKQQNTDAEAQQETLIYSMSNPFPPFIAESLKKNGHGLWVAINDALGTLTFQGCPQEINDNTHVPALKTAAIYFCRAGKKHIAQHTIGRQILHKGLKGYILNELCDYKTPRIVDEAILAHDPNFPDLGISQEAAALARHVDACCSRFSGDFPKALQEELEAWELAQTASTSSAMLPTGVSLIRLYHIFGSLRKAKEVEAVIELQMKQDHGAKSTERALESPRDYLSPNDMADGASIIFSTLAVSRLYRGEPFVAETLEMGVKICRDNNNQSILLPSFGRAWHAFILLESGNWQLCEKATENGEWQPDSRRSEKTQRYEILAAKMLFLKASHNAVSPKRRVQLLEQAKARLNGAILKIAGERDFEWWYALASLYLGQTALALGTVSEARNFFDSAIALSQARGFRLLEVDALVGQADVAKKTRQLRDAHRSAKTALAISDEIGYALRRKHLLELLS